MLRACSVMATSGGRRVPAAVSGAAAAGAGTAPLTTAPTIDYASYFTARSSARQPSAIRALQPLLAIPGMISLGGGMPNPSTFPFKAFSMTLQDGTVLDVSPEDAKAALQYGNTPGMAELVERLSTVQRAEHRPPPGAADFDLAVTNGSQDGLSKAFDMVMGPGDSLLVENPTYSGSLAFLEAVGGNLVNVDTDDQGLVPDALDALLTGWDAARDGRKPRVLYTVPTGGNPTGASLPVSRRKAIYDIARKHELLIFEDDPYYYLSFSGRLPSFFSMDEDGRVLRFDSFSKILSSGIRVGFVTGPKDLVTRINLHSQASNLHISGLSQMAVLTLLREWHVGDAGGGLGKLEDHVASVVEFYRGQCDAFVQSADRHLKGLVEYRPPTAGMFVWMRLLGVEDSFALIKEEAVKEKVLLVPGSSFIAGSPPSPFVRAAFSTATPEQIDTALERLGRLLRSVTGK